MKKSLLFLFTPMFMGVLFIVFAISMAFATFIENDYGAPVAMQWVYGSKWFELILVLLIVNLIGQIVINKLLNKKKFPILLFHLSFILIIIGAGITRYFGFDGSIHIREGLTQNICTSSEKYLQFSISDKQGKAIFKSEKQLVLTNNSVDRYTKDVVVENIPYSLKLTEFMPSSIDALVDDPDGKPIVSLMLISGMMGKHTVFFKEGDVKDLNGTLIGFGAQDSLDATISFEADSFYIQASGIIRAKSMKDQKITTHEKGSKITLEPMVIYNLNKTGFVIQKLSSKGVLKPIYHEQKQGGFIQRVLKFELNCGDKKKDMYLRIDKNPDKASATYNYNGNTIDITYGPKEIELPFEIKLNKFILERYPGSSSPSSYKSEVTLIDKEHHIERPFVIYMNHILKHRGYRFYQSSYDSDEKGTILSVNQDRFGMVVTYTGYFLLFIFIILSMIIKNSLFKSITINAWKSPISKATLTLIAILMSSNLSFGAGEKLVIDKTIADNFGKVLVQDQKGRTKPLLTLSNDIVRKVVKKNQFEGFSSMQVFLGFYTDFDNWKDVKLIKVANNDLAKNIGITGDYAAFSDIVDISSNNYKLAKLIEESNTKPEGSRNKFDKEVIKLDEKVNILYMIYTGEFLKIFPIKDKSTKWGSPSEAVKFAESKEDSLYLSKIIPMIIESATGASVSKNYKEVNELISSISSYQNKFSNYPLPSQSKVNIEVFYNKFKVFEKLFPFYATLGLILIIFLIYSIVSGKGTFNLTKYIGFLLFAGFILHTIGIIIRWYISGHAPLSNGYESMVFISWAIMLAGFILIKKSNFVLPAAAVLSSLTLLVAHFSFMDPEITNLVPVLKSYWLVLHVSVIISSYGFLGLGAIIGLLVMILYSLQNSKNGIRISRAVDELTIVNYQTLTLGLYLLTIGTFLGAIWANESWGRYWGWDPKETWSLITMVIYSFVIHSRMIKSFRSIYAFNLLSLFAFSSVLMTYFGVNYYLSGLHSYASGDPIPIPIFVYVTVFALLSISILALIRHMQSKRT